MSMETHSRRLYPTYIVPDEDPSDSDTPPPTPTPQKHMASRRMPKRGAPGPSSLRLVAPRTTKPHPERSEATVTSPSYMEVMAPHPEGGSKTTHLSEATQPPLVVGILPAFLAMLYACWGWGLSMVYMTLVYLILPFIIAACVCYDNLARHAYDYGGRDVLVQFLKSDVGLQEVADFALLFSISFCLLCCAVKGVATIMF